MLRKDNDNDNNKIIKEQKALLLEIKKACYNNQLEVTECKNIASHIKKTLKISQDKEEEKKETRRKLLFGIITLLLLSVISSAFYIKNEYFPSEYQISSSGKILDSTSYRYIPISTIKIPALAKFKITHKSKGLYIKEFSEQNGDLIFVEEEKDQFRLFYTYNNNLLTGTMQKDDNKLLEEKIILTNIKSASAAKLNNNYIVSYTNIRNDNIHLQFLDDQLSITNKNIEIKKKTNEDTNHIKLQKIIDDNKKSKERLFLLTQTKKEESSNPISPIIRELSNSLDVIKEKQLDTNSYNYDYNYTINSISDNLNIVTNGQNPFATTNHTRGDEIMLSKYDSNWDLYQQVELTKNGILHDFHPNYTQHIDKVSFIPIIRQDYLQNNSDKKIYPNDTGRVLLMAVDDSNTLLGTLNVTAPPQWEKGADIMLGAKNVFFFFDDKTITFFYDILMERDVYDSGNGSHRAIKTQKINYNLQKR